MTSTRTSRRRRRSRRSTSSSAPGTIGAAGASNFTAEQLAEALELSALEGVTRYEWVQNAFSLLEQGDRETVLPALPRARRRVHAVQPARRRLADRQVPPRRGAAGGLAHDDAPGGLRALPVRTRPSTRWRSSSAAAQERGCSMGALALAWLLSARDHGGRRRPEHRRAARAGAGGARPATHDRGARADRGAVRMSLLVLSDTDVRERARHGVLRRRHGGRARGARARRALDAAAVRRPAARRAAARPDARPPREAPSRSSRSRRSSSPRRTAHAASTRTRAPCSSTTARPASCVPCSTHPRSPRSARPPSRPSRRSCWRGRARAAWRSSAQVSRRARTRRRCGP